MVQVEYFGPSEDFELLARLALREATRPVQLYDPREWEIEEDEAISRMKTDELDRLVAAGTIREIDREHVSFIVRRIVQPPERPDDPRQKSDT